MLDEQTTEQRDLRGGRPPWRAGVARLRRKTLDADLRCDILVVGAGITGSIAAELLTRRGHDVVVVDRERPGQGSTAASTAMLFWEIDTPLAALCGIYGFERASHTYRRSLDATRGIIALAESLTVACGLHRRSALYLAEACSDGRDLREEHRLRTRAGLPGVLLDRQRLHETFGIRREAALLSPEVAEADPVRLAEGLLQTASARGARVFDAEAVGYDCAGGSVGVQLQDGHCVEARHVVLATGYVMPDFVRSELHQIVSSFAIATPPQAPKALWRDGTLIWEASQDYLYARTTEGGRIICGGEDDAEAVEPEQRNAVMPIKAAAILQRLSALWPHTEPRAELVWSGAFGTTSDGLPLIGRVPGHPGIVAAYGYGGNGITFSYLAAWMIGEMVAGRALPWFDDLAIDRDPPRYTR